MVVAHKCPVYDMLNNSELKLGQNKISCPQFCSISAVLQNEKSDPEISCGYI